MAPKDQEFELCYQLIVSDLCDYKNFNYVFIKYETQIFQWNLKKAEKLIKNLLHP